MKSRRALFTVISMLLMAAGAALPVALADVGISRVAGATFISDQFVAKTVLSADTKHSLFSFRKISVADLRDTLARPSLEKNGFAFVNFLERPGFQVLFALSEAIQREAAKGVHLRHEDQVNKAISAEMPAFEALIASWARDNLAYAHFDQVLCDSPVYRNTDQKLGIRLGQGRLAANAVPVFHIDFVEQQCMRDHLNDVGLLAKFKSRLKLILGTTATTDEFWKAKGRVVETLNIWMPLDKVTAKPLALMDITTLSHDAVVETIAKVPSNREKQFRSASPMFQQDQKFYFWSNMSPGEAIIFKSFKTPHAAVELPSDTGNRQSLDLRCYFIRYSPK